MSRTLALVEALEAEGMDPAAIIRVLKKAEQTKDTGAAERMRNMRARRKVGSVTRNVTPNPPNDNISNPPDVSEPSGSSHRPWALPLGVSLQVWEDFLKNRKRKRLPNTDTAWKGFNDDLRRVAAETGIPPPKLIERCTARGWGAIYDPRETRHGQQSASVGKSQAAYAMLNVDPDEPF